MERIVNLGHGLPPVCRLGLASRGNTHLRPSDVEYAIERGMNYLNWCGKPDGMSEAIAGLGPKRKDTVVAVQFQARTAGAGEKKFSRILKQIQSDSLDIATLYYVESEEEWRQIIAPGGVWDVLDRLRQQGALRMIGLTSHQRKLAAGWAQQTVSGSHAGQASGNDGFSGTYGAEKKNGVEAQAEPRPAGRWNSLADNRASGRYRLDILMIRYNATHRGAETEVFPVAAARRMPVVTFTGLRWRALLQPTPEDPAGFPPPRAPDCYRFCLSHPAVSVALTAPGNRPELEENLALLDEWRAAESSEVSEIRAHGDRVHRHAAEFW